jgi:5-methylcytosine-specific restriction endonuclease McrA
MIVRLEGPELAALRAACMERDGWRCATCNRCISDAYPDWHPLKAHMSHIISRGAGGPDTLGNVEASCQECHMDSHNSGGKVIAAK